MTFAQLQAFATTARLGSVGAAADELGISQPAVSGAIAALRRDLGDALFTRTEGGVTLTPGGTRLASVAAEILWLAERAKRTVGVSEPGGAGRESLRVAATSAVSEHVVPPLLDAFTRRVPDCEVSVQVEAEDALAGRVTDRVADVALGPRLSAGDMGPAIASTAFLRYRLIVVAGPRHRLAGRRQLAPALLAGERWIVGPDAADPARTAVGAFLERHRLAPEEIRAHPSDAAAAAATAAGDGVMLAIAHTVLDDLRRGALVRLDVRGTPVERLWFASTLADRRAPAAAALARFITSPEATQALLARSHGVPAERVRAPVHVTLWSAHGRAGEAPAQP